MANYEPHMHPARMRRWEILTWLGVFAGLVWWAVREWWLA